MAEGPSDPLNVSVAAVPAAAALPIPWATRIILILCVAMEALNLVMGDGFARIYGLKNAMAGELVEFANGVRGIALNLEEQSVGVAIMGEAAGIREGDAVRRTARIASVPVGPALAGRIVDGHEVAVRRQHTVLRALGALRHH